MKPKKPRVPKPAAVDKDTKEDDSHAIVVPDDAIEIDGSLLEGGGQILRTTSALANIFNRKVHIRKIRAGRAKPGLAAQHLVGLQLLRDVSHGTLYGDRVLSTEVLFCPGTMTGGKPLRSW